MYKSPVVFFFEKLLNIFYIIQFLDMPSIQEVRTKKGHKRYRVQIRRKGYNSLSAYFSKKTDAVKWAANKEQEIVQKKYFPNEVQYTHSFFELIDKYTIDILSKKTRNKQTTTGHLKWWKKEIGDLPLNSITPQMIAQKRDQLLEEQNHIGKNRSNATVVRYLSTLSHLFSTCQNEWGWITSSPLKKVKRPKEPKGRCRYLNEEELTRLLKEAQNYSNPLFYPLILISLMTGGRQSEVLNLTWEDIDWKNSLLFFKDTKNKETRSIPISEKIRNTLKDIKEKNPSTLFIFENPFQRRPIHIRYGWAYILKRAKIKDFKWHDIRHCTGSYLAMNGASILEIAEILGHKSLKMTKRYTHLSTKHTSKVLNSLNDKLSQVFPT